MRFVLDLDRWVRDSKVMSGPSLLEPLSGTVDRDIPESGLNADISRLSGKCGDGACVCTCGGFLWLDTAANDRSLSHPQNNWLFLLHSNDFAKLCPFTQRKGFLPKLSGHVLRCCLITATLCSRSGRKTSPERGICRGAPTTTATLQKSVLISAGSHGVNTLLLLLLSKPHPC